MRYVVSDRRHLFKLIGLLALVINRVDGSLVIVSLVVGAQSFSVVEGADLGKVLECWVLYVLLGLNGHFGSIWDSEFVGFGLLSERSLGMIGESRAW